jgi:hypothetical protein
MTKHILFIRGLLVPRKMMNRLIVRLALCGRKAILAKVQKRCHVTSLGTFNTRMIVRAKNTQPLTSGPNL